MRLAAASIGAFSADLTAAGCGGSDTEAGFPAACTTPTYKLTHLVVTYTGAKPAAGGSTIQEDFPCHGP